MAKAIAKAIVNYKNELEKGVVDQKPLMKKILQKKFQKIVMRFVLWFN